MNSINTERTIAMLLIITPRSSIQADSTGKLYDATGLTGFIRHWIFGGDETRAAIQVKLAIRNWIVLKKNDVALQKTPDIFFRQIQRVQQKLEQYNAYHSSLKARDPKVKKHYEEALKELNDAVIKNAGNKKKTLIETLTEQLVTTLNKKELGGGAIARAIINECGSSPKAAAKTGLGNLKKELMDYLDFVKEKKNQLNEKKNQLEVDCLVLKSELEVAQDEYELEIKKAEEEQDYYRKIESTCRKAALASKHLGKPKGLENDRLLQDAQKRIQELDPKIQEFNRKVNAFKQQLATKRAELYGKEETLREIENQEIPNLNFVLKYTQLF